MTNFAVTKQKRCKLRTIAQNLQWDQKYLPWNLFYQEPWAQTLEVFIDLLTKQIFLKFLIKVLDISTLTQETYTFVDSWSKLLVEFEGNVYWTLIIEIIIFLYNVWLKTILSPTVVNCTFLSLIVHLIRSFL